MRSLKFINSAGIIQNKPTDNAYYQSVISFLADFRANPEIRVQTSGSTGKPKEIILSKAQIIASVNQTAAAFNLSKNDIAFCSLPVSYIAGKLMLLRAEILGMHAIVTEPSGNPFNNFNEETTLYFQENSGHFLFAFVPYQLQNIVNDSAAAKLLSTAKAILSGGAPLNRAIEDELLSLQLPVYETYGMTETVTHVALRQINGDYQNRDYHFLPGINHRTTEDNRLAIKGLVTNNAWIQTNDIIAYTSANSFNLLGRADNVINSGGVKLHPERIEEKIHYILESNNINSNFFCYGKPDSRLGESLVLFIESADNIDIKRLQKELNDKLPKYDVPKEIILVNNFVYTSSNKLNRKLTAQKQYT